MKKFFALAASVSISCGVLAGCSSTSNDDPSIDSMSDEALTASIRSKLSPVKGGFEKPSGVVNAQSMPRLIDSMENSSSATGATSYSGTPFALPKSSGLKTKTFRLGPLAGDLYGCFTADGNTMSYDMGCLSEGEVTGTMVWRAVYDQTNHQNYSAMIKMNNICTKKDGGGCMNGEMFMESFTTGEGENSELTWTIYEDIEIKSPSYNGRIKFGMRMRIKGGLYGSGGSGGGGGGGTDSFTLEMSAYDGESSFVYSGSSDRLVVTGSNGRFECSYENDGEHGTCESSTGEKWTW
jgi:hypothetical protein